MVQNDKTLKRQDDAVSEIIGEIMMLAITVMIFAILIATVSSVISKPRTEIVRMDVQALDDSTLTIRHMGGDTIQYTYLAVVVDGNVISATASDTNANDLWDLGENLLVSGVNTSHRLSVMVYDSMTNNVLGDVTVDTLPAGLPVTQPSPSPTATPSVTPTATPVQQLHHFTITASNPWTGTPGDSLTVTAYDQYGNVYTGYRGLVYFSSSINKDNFDYYNHGHDYGFTAADNGTHVFTGHADLEYRNGIHKITVQEHQGPSGSVDIQY